MNAKLKIPRTWGIERVSDFVRRRTSLDKYNEMKWNKMKEDVVEVSKDEKYFSNKKQWKNLKAEEFSWKYLEAKNVEAKSF